MTDLNRRPLQNRAAALLAGPLLLSQRALALVFQPGREAPPEAAPRITVTPPEHAIKRRG